MFNLIDALFGCDHKHCTFPITVKPGHPHPCQTTTAGTYIVCLDCGKEFGYDWEQMKVVETVQRAA